MQSTCSPLIDAFSWMHFCHIGPGSQSTKHMYGTGAYKPTPSIRFT